MSIFSKTVFCVYQEYISCWQQWSILHWTQLSISLFWLGIKTINILSYYWKMCVNSTHFVVNRTSGSFSSDIVFIVAYEYSYVLLGSLLDSLAVLVQHPGIPLLCVYLQLWKIVFRKKQPEPVSLRCIVPSTLGFYFLVRNQVELR